MTVSTYESESSLLDGLGSSLLESPDQAIAALVGRLSATRRVLPESAWRLYCAGIASHPSLSLLTQDPYTRDARAKASGYAGDARTLDYVYQREHRDVATTPLGEALFRLTTGVPIAAAVRSRRDAIALEVSRFVEQRSDPHVIVSSIACGHARELDSIARPVAARLRYWGVDQDARTIATASDSHASVLELGSRFEASSIGSIIRGATAIPASDLVYASGLFDYLDVRTGGLLLRRMVESLTARGKVMIANLSPVNDEIAFMEAIMDWWMVYRTEEDMLALAEGCGLSSESYSVSTTASFDSRLSWLIVERRGDSP